MQPDQTGKNTRDKISAGFRNLMSPLRRKKLWLFLPTLFVCALSLLYVFASQNLYVSQSRIAIVEAASGADEAVEALMIRLTSAETINKVIVDLGLERRAEFDPLANGIGLPRSFMIGIGLATDPRQLSKSERVFTSFSEQLSVQRISATNSVIVRFSAQDPELAASIANRVADEAIKSSNRASSQPQSAQTQAYSTKLSQIEAQIEALKSAKLPPDSKRAVADSKSALKSQILHLQSRAAFIREAVRLGRISEVNDMVSQGVVQRLLEQRKQIKSQIAVDERNLSPTTPKMKELFTQLNAVDSQLRISAEKTAQGFEDEARNVAAANGITLPLEGGKQNSDTLAQNNQILTLEQEAAQLRAKIANSRSDEARTSLTSGDTSIAAKVTEKAKPSKSTNFLQKLLLVFKNTLVCFAICFLGLIIAGTFSKAHQGAGGASSLSSLDAGMSALDAEPSDLVSTFDWAQDASHPAYRSELKMPLQPSSEAINQNTPGTILPGQGTPLPQPEATPPLETLPASLANWTEAHSHLHKNASNTLNGGVRDKSVVEDISRELQCMGYLGRGKVTIIHGMEIQARSNLHAVRLGRRLSKEGATVTIELFKKDALYAQLTGQNLAGLGNYLEDEASLAEIIHRDAKSKLHVIPLGGYQGFQTSAAKHKDKLEFIINLLTQSYSHIVVDAGPVGSDGEVLLSSADAVVVITKSDTANATLMRTVDRLETVSGKPIFVVQDEFMDNPAEQMAASPRIIGAIRK